MATRKLIDLTGAPAIVELREDGKWYIVGVKLRKREFLYDSMGLPMDIVEKLEGTPGDGKINGLNEIEDFLEGQEEGEKLSDKTFDGFVTDEDVTDAWQDMLNNAQASASQE